MQYYEFHIFLFESLKQTYVNEICTVFILTVENVKMFFLLKYRLILLKFEILPKIC
jgi:hypothetical protein